MGRKHEDKTELSFFLWANEAEQYKKEPYSNFERITDLKINVNNDDG